MEARRWLAQAQDDLRFAHRILADDDFFDKGCFISQQAAEKALKAVHYFDGARTVLGHSAAELIEALIPSRPEYSRLLPDARRIDQFYIPTRYPNGLPGGVPYQSYTREDLENAVGMAERIVAAAAEIIGP